MILDDLKNCQRYLPLHAGFERGFAVLHDIEMLRREPGKYPLDGERLTLIIGCDDGRGRTGAKLESHRLYIDIQYVIAGDEEIGWLPTAACQQVSAPYTPDRDIAFYDDAPESWFRVPPGKFAIFYPDDAHAPLAGAGQLRKAVIKVAVDW